MMSTATNHKTGFAHIGSDLAVIKWMIGFNLAMTTAVLWKVFAT
jgi:hypothetical protein